MVLITFNNRYTGAVPGDMTLSQSEFNRLKREAWEEVGKYWHDELRPKHFTAAGAKEYNYQPRDGEAGGTKGGDFWRSYTGRKQKQKGHTLPLVFSGEARDLSRMCRIYATSKGVRVAYADLSKLNFKNPKAADPPDMAKEFTTISADEEKILAHLFDAIMDRHFRRFSKVATRRIG